MASPYAYGYPIQVYAYGMAHTRMGKNMHTGWNTHNLIGYYMASNIITGTQKLVATTNMNCCSTIQ